MRVEISNFGEKIERLAAAAVVDKSKWKLDALQARCAEPGLEVTCLHREVDVVNSLRVELTELDQDVENMIASLTDSAGMRDEIVERADDLSAQLAASARRRDAYTSRLAAEKKNFYKFRVERANLRWLVNRLDLNVREF